MQRYEIHPERSTIIVDAKSSVGPIVWQGRGPRGEFSGVLTENGLDFAEKPTGWLELPLENLTSGNSVYDAELLRRMNARRYPDVRVELQAATSGAASDRLQVTGSLGLVGEQRPVEGEIEFQVRDDGRVLVTGEQRIDIRDFGMPAPTMLMLKVYPDVRVRIVLEGTPVD